MKILLPIFSLLFLFSSIASAQMSATLTIQDQQYLSESYQVEGEFYSYSPYVFFLQAESQQYVPLEFQFFHEDQLINQLNYKEKQLRLVLDYPKSLLTCTRLPIRKKQLLLNIETQDILAKDSLNFYLTNNTGEMVAKFSFLFEITYSYSLSQNGNNIHHGPVDTRLKFSEAPLLIHMTSMLSQLDTYYPLDSTIVIPMRKEDQYTLRFFIHIDTIINGDEINELEIETVWVGKGLIQVRSEDDQAIRFHIFPKSNEQLNKKWQTYLPSIHFANSSHAPPPTFSPRPDLQAFDDKKIKNTYTMEIQILDRRTQEKNSKTLIFWLQD